MGLAHLVVVMVVAVLEDLVRLEGGRELVDSNRKDFRFELHPYRGKGRYYDMPYLAFLMYCCRICLREQNSVILYFGLLYTEC